MIMLTAGGCPPGQGGLRAVQNGAMTPRTSQRGLDRNPSIWHWTYPPRRIAISFLSASTPRLRPPHHQHARHAQAQAVSDTDRVMLMSDPAAFDR